MPKLGLAVILASFSGERCILPWEIRRIIPWRNLLSCFSGTTAARNERFAAKLITVLHINFPKSVAN
jgi:hypothetical protein